MVAILILWAHVSSVQCERKRRPYGWSNADENHLQRRINAQQLYSVYNKIEGATRFSSRRNFPFIRDDKCECEIWRKEEIELISNNECMHLSTSTLHENASHEWNDPTNRYIYIYMHIKFNMKRHFIIIHDLSYAHINHIWPVFCALNSSQHSTTKDMRFSYYYILSVARCTFIIKFIEI